MELERPEATTCWKSSMLASTRSVDDVVRIHNGRLLLGTRFGPLDEAISHARPMTTLVRGCGGSDRSHFLLAHSLRLAFRLTARYEEAHEAVAQGLKESRAFTLLTSPNPTCFLLNAGAAIGVRRFSEASGILDRVQKLSEKLADEYLTMSTRAMPCRLLLAEGSPEAALAATSGSLLRVSSKGQKSEFLASRSLAYARIGDLDRAQEFSLRPTGLSGELEAVRLCRWTRVLLGLQVERARVAKRQ